MALPRVTPVRKAPKAPSTKALFKPTLPHAPKLGASHPHLKRSKLSVSGKSSFGKVGQPAFPPATGGAAFGDLGAGGGAPAFAPPAGGDQEQGPPPVQD